MEYSVRKNQHYMYYILRYTPLHNEWILKYCKFDFTGNILQAVYRDKNVLQIYRNLQI